MVNMFLRRLVSSGASERSPRPDRAVRRPRSPRDRRRVGSRRVHRPPLRRGARPRGLHEEDWNPVKLLAGSTGELFERLKAEGDRTPADVLLTVDAGNLWNAARAGLLSQIDSPELASNVPASLRDPVRARTIMYNTSKVKPAELSTYEALGDSKWKGRLCLRTSGYIYNQSLLATMIKRYGEARTGADDPDRADR